MNEQKNNGRGVFYGVIGVATLVVAIIGATFAYFTATASNNTVISGNMATIEFGLEVTKVTDVDDDKGGMIPMSNTMVEAAVSDSNYTYDQGTEATDDDVKGTGTTCVDDNGNAVCQIYKITVSNTGSASLFLDGYVSLTGGSGDPTDYTYTVYHQGEENEASYATTMRWAQVFCTGDITDGTITNCSTIGKTTTGATSTTTTEQTVAVTSGITENWATIGALTAEDNTGKNTTNILTSGVTAKGAISGNPYDIIYKNYIRVSDHEEGTAYKRTTDVTSALVFNQYLDAKNGTNASQDFYIVVWLSENGLNQTTNNPEGSNTNANVPTSSIGFFDGNVTFNSAQGSEVTATFSGLTAVPSDQA